MAASTPPVAILEGTIVEILSGARWYLVRTGVGDIECSALSSAGSRVLNPKTIGVYSMGDPVLVAITFVSNAEGQPIVREPAYILGAAQLDVATGLRKYRSCDYIYQMAGATAMNDTVHKFIADNFPNQYRDFNIGQPLDAIPGSDFGYINEMGVGYGLARLMAWMRASEAAGIWFFFQDHLTRLVAYNYDFWHSGGERWIRNDEGEVNDVDMLTPYPWEALGLTEPNTAALDEQQNGGMYTPGQHQLMFEPDIRQLMLPRLIRMRGYLGDVERELVVKPYTEVTASETGGGSYEQPEAQYTGLLDIQKHSNGLYTVRSANGIIFEKRIFIPVPKQLEPPEQADTKGDGATNYRASGVWGDGATPGGTGEDALAKPHDKSEWRHGPARQDLWAAELFDYHAYLFNWFALKPTYAHTRDWQLPEEGLFADIADLKSAYVPTKESEGEQVAYPLDKDFVYPLPGFAEVQIDHRVGSTRYYFSRSVVAQMPDGSILIEDGYGSAIHMTGGNIYVTAPGDTWLKPGRNVVIWAPDDFIARAGSSFDITAANGDGRIKAERNLHCLAGNSGVAGGILLESRGVYENGGEFKYGEDYIGEDIVGYGIIIKATTPKGLGASPLMIYGSDLYLRALRDADAGGVVNGQIVLEADADIVESAQNYYQFAKEGIGQVIGQTLVETADGTILDTSYVNRIGTEYIMLGSKKIPLLFRGGQDGVASPIGAVFDMGDAAMLMSGKLGIKMGIVYIPPNVIDAQISTATALFDAWKTTSLPPELDTYYTEVYEDNIRGVTKFVQEFGFTCRTVLQYGYGCTEPLKDLLLAESRWQQMYREKDIGKLWVEPVIVVPGIRDEAIKTMPHPGYERWVEADMVYVMYDTELWDWETLHSVARGVSADVDDSPYTGVQAGKNYLFSALETGYRVSKQLPDEEPEEE